MSLRVVENSPYCTPFTRELLARVGDKWSMMIIGKLSDRPMRFNELRRAMGQISQRMLTHSLKSLEKDGLVTRTVFPTIPPKVEYALTPLGTTLLSPIEALLQWATEHRANVEAARQRFEAQQGGETSTPPPLTRRAAN